MHDLPEINEEMKILIAELIAKNIDREPTTKHIIVDSLDLDIPVIIAEGLKKFRPADVPEQNECSKLWLVYHLKYSHFFFSF